MEKEHAQSVELRADSGVKKVLIKICACIRNGMSESLQVTERNGYFYDTGRSFIWIFDSMQFTGYEREKGKTGSLILV